MKVSYNTTIGLSNRYTSKHRCTPHPDVSGTVSFIYFPNTPLFKRGIALSKRFLSSVLGIAFL